MKLTAEQERAVGRRDGSLLVSAGAGTGKTTVLVSRFVRAVVDDGEPVAKMLAITFTEKAATQMRVRVREGLIAAGRRDLAREAENAWISTIHGFCSRVLRAHALSAGIDPEYRVLDEIEARRIALDAFDRALEDFLGEGRDPQRLEFVASYAPDKLRDMAHSAYALLRSQGQRTPQLPVAELPRGGGERERLAAAARAALAELGAVGGGVTVTRAMARMEACGAALELQANGLPAALRDFDGWVLKGRANALESAACEEYREALEGYRALRVAHDEQRDHTLLRALLDLYGGWYEQLKRARSGLDFEDLQLLARDLLVTDEGLREHLAGRFSHVLVDEFQDVNPLQNELLRLLERDNLFRVGDENQSIYRFRNAEVAVFRSHRDEARAQGRAESITENFRSRGEVLDAIDLAFERTWGERFEPLRAPAGAPEVPPRVSPCVELLVTDKSKARWEERFAGDEQPFGPSLSSANVWRACEARLLAKRIDELTGEGAYEVGEVVLLLRATTHMSFYERALEERGIPTYVVGGRGYWSQQQVSDLRHWLGALANPTDDLAVLSVLASPLVGASLDALALAGLEARRSGRGAWWTLSEPGALMERLPEPDRARIARFVEIFKGERADAPRVSLEALIDRAVTRTGYDLHLLRLPAGERRMANVRKLMRMAREYEAGEGRDLRGFIDFVAERDVTQGREGEAPLEAEHVRAVRLMTVHRAKGLEFPVVCVADLGKNAREDDGSLRISSEGEMGMRLASLGGGHVDTARLARIKDGQKRAAEEEEKRIFYVAVTRAQEHLVLSGATDLDSLPEEKELCEPMRWVWRSFCAGLPADGAVGEHVDAYGGREVRVRWQRCTPATLDELLPEEDRAPARVEAQRAPSFAQPPLELGSIPARPALPVSRLSYSALEAYARCSYRFYLERALRLPRPDDAELPVPVPDAGGAAGDGELSALLRGTLVHELLERLDLGDPRLPSDAEVAALAERHGHRARPAEVADLQGMVRAFAGGELRARVARASRVRKELRFAFTLAPPEARGRSLLVNGVVDVLAEEGDGALVIDYKSDRLGDSDPAVLCGEQYATQRLIYALAALRSGSARAEVVHLFLERPDEPVSAAFGADEAPELEARLLGLASGVVRGRFEPTGDPHRELCVGCPGQPTLCSWPLERTLAPRVAV